MEVWSSFQRTVLKVSQRISTPVTPLCSRSFSREERTTFSAHSLEESGNNNPVKLVKTKNKLQLLAAAFLALAPITATLNGAIILNEFNFNPDGVEYVVLTVTGSEDLSDFNYSFAGGETLGGGTFALADSPNILSEGETIVISRLPQIAFDLVHAVDSSAVGEFIYNSQLDLSSDFQFEITDTSSDTAESYNTFAPSGALCCIIGPDGVTYIECERPLTNNNSFVSTGTPAYVPEPSSALLSAFGLFALLTTRRRRV